MNVCDKNAGNDMITGSFADCMEDVDVIFLMKNAKHCIIPSCTKSSRRTEVL